MPLTIVPDAGDVLMCQFDGSPPEMTKLRRVIVLTPRNRAYFPDTFLVVPVSKSRPTRPDSHHWEFKPRAYDFFDPIESVLALGNMLTCVKKSRLDRMRIQDRFSRAQISRADLNSVRSAVLHAIGMQDWHQVLETKALSAIGEILKIKLLTLVVI